MHNLSSTGLLVATLLLPAAARCQWRLYAAPVAGGAVSTVHFERSTPQGRGFHDYNRNRTPYRAGAHAGLLLSLAHKRWALQPTVLYAQRGYRQSFYISGNRVAEQLDYSGITRLNYLTVPLNVIWSQRPDGTGWQGFAGGYVSRWLSGHYRATVAYSAANDDGVVLAQGEPIPYDGPVADGRHYDEYRQNYYNTHGKEPSFINAWDAGIQAGIGYRHQHFQLQAGYSLGLRNIAEHNFAAAIGIEGFPYRSRAAYASLAYLLPFNGSK